jgi:GNAT superfamily N-acetyltransferase
MTINIRPVKTWFDKRRFIRLPWRLYRDDPNWVPPLLMDMNDTLNPKKNALLALGPYQYFLAYRDGIPAGRIGVGVDNHLNEIKNYKSSYLTLFESVNDYEVAKALFDTGLAWAKQHGAEFITGPQSPTNGDDYRGLLIKGFDSPPVLLNSYNPLYYQDFFTEYGFEKQFDRNAYYIDIAHSELPEQIVKTVEYAKKRYGYRVAPLDMKRFKEHVEAIVQISVAAWPADWPDMVPPTPEEVRAEVSKLKSVIDPRFVFFAWDKENHPIGYGVTFPNYNELLIKMNGRLFPFGIFIFLLGKKKIKSTRSFILFTIPEYQKKGVSSAIYLEGIKAVKALGCQWADFSTIHEFNNKMNQDAVGAGGELYKIFRIFIKNL